MNTLKIMLQASCAIGAAMALSGAALGQTSATTAAPTNTTGPEVNTNPTAPQEEANGLQEIVVTANKREENLQKVAAAVTAVSPTTLQRQGVKEIFDLIRVVPEVQVLGGALTQVTIRGIRTGASGPTTDSPNAVHIDGAYVSRFTSIQGLFFDVQRIEVLAGPQGTLYGRNAAGGTLNIITNKPTQEFGGYGTVEFGNYHAINVNAALNLPITDNMAFRVAYFRNKRRGYVDNGVFDADQEAVRAALQWRPTTRDTILITGDYETVGGRTSGPLAMISNVLKQPTIVTNGVNGGVCPGGVYVCAAAAGATGGVIVPIKTASDPRNASETFGSQDNFRQDTRGGGIMGQIDHDLGFATLTFQGSYRYSDSFPTSGTLNGFPQDPRLVTANVLRPAVLNVPNVGQAHWDSQELRLTSPANQPLTYVIGLYRFHEKSFNADQITYLATYPNTSAATLGQVIYDNPLKINRRIPNDNAHDDAYAVFGQATYTPEGFDRIHITGGLRYNYEKKFARGSTIVNGALFLVPQLTGPPLSSAFDLSNSWKKLTYKTNIAFDVTPTTLIYVDHSTGFKSGGFGFGPTPEYKPETIKAYEAGLKSRFLNNRVQVNAAIWHYDQKNYVSNVTSFVPDNTQGGRFVSLTNSGNAGSTKVDGQSVNFTGVITDNDILAINAAHVNSRYKVFDIGNNYLAVLAPGTNGGLLGATPAFFNFSGTPVTGIPDWAINATFDHSWEMMGGKFDAQPSLHTSRQVYNGQVAVVNVNNQFGKKFYTTYDFSLRYDRDDAKWSITAYVRNIANTDVVTARGYTSNEPYLPISDPRVPFAYQTKTYGAPPRTFGVIVNAQF